jgi:hypothetical protein
MPDMKTQIHEAKAWLQENPSEKPATAARIFKVNPDSLRRSIARDLNINLTPVAHGGQNKVLSDTQIRVLKQWIQRQYEAGLGATRQMTYAAVCHLCRPRQAPSHGWMTNFMKTELFEFHTITTKPISRQRTTAQDESLVSKWFNTYAQFLESHGILPDDIWNMDETGFRVGIPGGEEVIVPVGVQELYTPSPENRSSITVIETVSALGKAIPPVLIVQGKKHMESWYHENLDGGERILLSDSGYTNDDLALKWLQHFILHTGSSKDSNRKVLLLDSHASHRTPEFTILADENRIFIYAFPSHLTHILQPLDVGIFHPYKHWHKKAVQFSIRNLDLEYNISSFMRDLSKIRTDTFKERTIIHAFANSGMWPVGCDVALEKIKKYSKPEPGYPQTPAPTPQSFRDSEVQLQTWKSRIPILLSSPSRRQYQDFCAGTEEVLINGQIQELEHSILQKQILEQRNQKSKSRRSLQTGGVLTATAARQLQNQKLQKQVAIQEKRVARAVKAVAVLARKQLHKAGVDARKQERARRKTVAGLLKAKQLVPVELQEPIPDPEALAKEQAIEITTEIDSSEESDESDESIQFFLG